MNLKYFLPYIVLLVVFGLISLLVYTTAGKSSFFLAKKLKIGGLLLVISTFLWGCHLQAEKVQVSCYDINPVNYITIENAVGRVITIKANATEINGTIINPDWDLLQYRIEGKKSGVLANGSLSLKKDINGSEQTFKIILASPLALGEYRLVFFYLQENKEHFVVIYKLTVTND